MKKLFIKNRKGQKLSVLIEEVENSKGLAFVMHGLGGSKEQTHIQTFAESFLEEGFNVIRFDTTNSYNESEGEYENATVTNYYEDLEDVIKWAKTQSCYSEPFYLCGHSLGGICISLYAQKNPEEVKALAPISTVISGKLSLEKHSKEELKEWEEKGFIIKESSSIPRLMKKLKWTHMTDRLKYNLLENIDKLKMPILMIVGENDTSTPPKHQEILFERLLGEKELHLVKNAPHTFKDKEHLKDIKEIFKNWIRKIEQ